MSDATQPSATLFVTCDDASYSRHKAAGRRVLAVDDLANGSPPIATRVVLCGKNTDAGFDLVRERFASEVRVIREGNLTEVRTRSLADVEVEPVSWLWPGYIAAGKLTIMSGDPGCGKTWLLLDVAARLSRGDCMPDGTGGGDPAGVLFISYDDGIADTLKKRAVGLRADHSRIVALDGNYDGVGESRYIPPEAIESILIAAEDEERRMKCPIRLVVLDPLSAVLGGVDQNQSNSIYDKLGPLITHCEDAGMALVCIDHTGKNRPDKAINMATGSQGKAALARLMSVIVDSGDDDGSSLLLSSKNSLAPFAPGMRFSIEDVPIRSVVEDANEAAATAAELKCDNVGTIRYLGSIPQNAQQWVDEQRDAIAECNSSGLGGKAIEALAIVLERMGQGVRLASDIQQAVEDAGMSWRTAQHAAKAVGIEKDKTTFGWIWRFQGEHPDAALDLIRSAPSSSAPCGLSQTQN